VNIQTVFERIFLWVIMSAMLALVGVATFAAYSYGVDIYRAYVLSDAWEKSTGTIASSRAVKGCGKGGSGYALDVTYRYKVDGVEFTSDKVWFGNGYCHGKAGAEGRAARYLVGAQTFVYFNPRAPAESVLVRGRVENGTIFLFLLLLTAPLGAMALLVMSVVTDRRLPPPPSIQDMLRRREQIDRSIRIEIQERSAEKKLTSPQPKSEASRPQ
jgi:hypothetical protein